MHYIYDDIQTEITTATPNDKEKATDVTLELRKVNCLPVDEYYIPYYMNNSFQFLTFKD